jgi:hypothetical protein
MTFVPFKLGPSRAQTAGESDLLALLPHQTL